MNKQETARLLAVIKTAFPNFEITEPVVRLWHEFLTEIEYERAQENLRQHIKISRFQPTISDIMKKDETTSHHEQLRLETAERFALMDEWERKAVPMPDWIAEKWGKKK